MEIDFGGLDGVVDVMEYVSIMFEMKNEADTTATKHKNEDFLSKLDRGLRDVSIPCWCRCLSLTVSFTMTGLWMCRICMRRCLLSDLSFYVHHCIAFAGVEKECGL